MKLTVHLETSVIARIAGMLEEAARSGSEHADAREIGGVRPPRRRAGYRALTSR